MTKKPGKERLDRIRASAAEHHGVFLLQRRGAPRRLEAEIEVDRDYDACDDLVNTGEAQWLRPDAGAPGIRIIRPPGPTHEGPALMGLDEALRILAETHTREDHDFGFTVSGLANYHCWPEGMYRRAWETVRRHLRLQIDPPGDKA